MDLKINETLQTGAVKNRTYQVRGESIRLFFEFTIVRIYAVSRCESRPIGGCISGLYSLAIVTQVASTYRLGNLYPRGVRCRNDNNKIFGGYNEIL